MTIQLAARAGDRLDSLDSPDRGTHPGGEPSLDPQVALEKQLFWRCPETRCSLYEGDCLELLARLPEASVDVIFADPPYFLSNGGTTCRSGKRKSVDKGGWDKSRGVEDNHEFNRAWLSACKRVLSENGTIWVSGTAHVIYSVGFAMQQLGFKMLNDIIWEKPNPPPNLSCRYFTHSTEIVLWAARSSKSKHHFAYTDMRNENGGKQMKNVWRFTAPGKQEKLQGRHPTQKPLRLLERILAASCPENAVVLDPFNGSGTTGLAAARAGLRYIGIEREREYLELSKARLLEAKSSAALAKSSLDALPPPPAPKKTRSRRKRSPNSERKAANG